MLYQYKLSETGKATDLCVLRNINKLEPGFISVEEKPDDISIYNTNEYTEKIIYDDFIKEKNRRILESDKLELPSIQKRYNITQDQVEEYKHKLWIMKDTHTTIEQLENPEWPEKLIKVKLL